MKLRGTMWAALVVLPLLSYSTALGHASYTGYSGATGSRGTCASDCHGSTGGTIEVSGFPVEYTPGQSYPITVRHVGGSAIGNFNCSVREGNGSNSAGTLAAGLFTATYAVNPQEPRGIHFSSANKDSGLFTWTAPDPGVGAVTLYLAGMQGTSSSGPNSMIVLTASQSLNGISDDAAKPLAVAFRLENRVVRDYLILQVSLPTGIRAQVRIVNGLGRPVSTIPVPQVAGVHSLIWEPIDDRGGRLAAGGYFALLVAEGRRQTHKFVIAD